MASPSPWLPSSLIATWFGSGLLPVVPGTWGSLAALPFALAIVWLAGPWALLAATAAVFALGLWAAGSYERVMEVKDPGSIVVDEVAGQWLVLFILALRPEGLSWREVLLAFVLFRVFDTVKPWPVSWADRHLKGAFGIMADDIVAALYAALLAAGILWLLEKT